MIPLKVLKESLESCICCGSFNVEEAEFKEEGTFDEAASSDTVKTAPSQMPPTHWFKSLMRQTEKAVHTLTGRFIHAVTQMQDFGFRKEEEFCNKNQATAVLQCRAVRLGFS